MYLDLDRFFVYDGHIGNAFRELGRIKPGVLNQV